MFKWFFFPELFSMLKYKMPSFMITFRPHPNEPSILDTFLHLFFASDLFLKATEYKYNIEKDGTPDRHFHIFLSTELCRDKEKVYNFLSVKEFKQFKEWLIKKDTEFTHGLNVILSSDKTTKRNDRLYRIGYVSKDRPSPFGALLTTDMSCELIKQALDYMVEWDRIHVQKTDYSKDIKNLTMKTVLPEVIYYHKEKGYPLDQFIFDRMALDGVFTVNLTDSQEKKIIRQLRIYFKQEVDIPEYHTVSGGPGWSSDMIIEKNKKILFSEYCKQGD